MNADVVVFRRWKDSGDLIALFPENPSDVYGRYCDSYELVGQHGDADYHGVIQATVPVEPPEYAELAEELHKIGYDLRPIKRASSHHHDKRRQAARAFRSADTVWRFNLTINHLEATNLANGKAKFSLGQLLATLGAVDALEESGQTPMEFIGRHAQGDWGDVCDEDKMANDHALIDGSRLLSAYRTLKGKKLWVITEATDDDGNRAATTILLPSEY